MALPATPQNLTVEHANQQIHCTWDAQAGATSYKLQRSTDGVNWSALATPSINSYTDTTVALGTMYWYRVAATGTSGDSGYSIPDQTVPAPNGEASLYELRLQAKEMADRVNSEFVTKKEWNAFINRALFELYDILVTAFEDYFVASPIHFVSSGTTQLYPLPNGSLSFLDSNNQSAVAPAFYKLLGVDMGISTVNRAYVTMKKFNLIDRNKYFYPTSGGTVYGVFNMQYRVLGDKIEFIPTPVAGQPIQLWYIPRMTKLLKDTDITSFGISGWLEYVIVRAAKYALDKEESDTSKLDAALMFLKQRIEEAAQNRDAGQPDTVTDVRQSGPFGGGGAGFPGPLGGW